MEPALKEFLSVIGGQGAAGFLALLAGDAVIWHNDDGVEMPAKDALGV